jgi:uncharacterized membrane protein YvlD (DUF360 family)
MVVTYIVLFLVNSIVIYLANYIFPQFVALGTATTSKTWAIIQSMGILALVNLLVIPFVREFERRRKKMFTSKEWMILYFLINTVALWIIARFAFYLGFGISSWMVAVGLAIVLDVLQGIAVMQVEKLKKKSS